MQGDTCTGSTAISQSPCQIVGHSDVFITVDNPNRLPLRLTASPGFSMLGYQCCDSLITANCALGAPGAVFDPIADFSLFAVERVDGFCGPFTLTVTAR